MSIRFGEQPALLSCSAPALPGQPAQVEEHLLNGRIMNKGFSNQGMDLTVAVAQQIKRFIAAGKVSLKACS